MASGNLIVALAKVLIAASWADGELDVEEVNIMKDLLFTLPRANTDGNSFYTATEWAEIEMYLDSPVDAQERARLVEDMRELLKTPEDKAMVLNALDELIRADGVVSVEDDYVVVEIQSAIDNVDFGFFSHLSQLLSGPRQRRSQALKDAPNRELYLDDFTHNKVYYGVRRRLDLGEGVDFELDDLRLRRLSAVGGLLARVAQVDLPVTEDEVTKMIEVLQEFWQLSREEAVFVAEVAISEISPSMDTVRLVREIYSAVQPEQVSTLLDLLFAVALADGYVSSGELDEIYEISRSLGLAHRTFIDAKLKVPVELREA